jgi:hypothetical protein
MLEPEDLQNEIDNFRARHKPKPREGNALHGLGMVTSMGFVMVFAIYGGYMLGGWLDKIRGTDMVFTLSGLFAGILLGAYAVYQLLKPFLKGDV